MALPAEIDLTNAEQAFAGLCAAFTSSASIVIADFTGTAFCDCSSLRRLLGVPHRAGARPGQLRLVIPPGSPVRRLAAVIDLNRWLPVYASPAEAAAARTPTAGLPAQQAGGPAAPETTADITDLIAAGQLHIMRWQARLGQLRAGGAGPGPALAATWDTLASLIDLQMHAEDEICGPAICGSGPDGRALTWTIRDAHEDIREIIGEANLQRPGSPLWWRTATTALAAWTQQVHREVYGPLADYRRRADPALRRRLSFQWRAFTEAQIRDRYPQAPPQVPTCQLRQLLPVVPRLERPAFAPLSCTCQGCTQELNEADGRIGGPARYDQGITFRESAATPAGWPPGLGVAAEHGPS